MCTKFKGLHGGWFSNVKQRKRQVLWPMRIKSCPIIWRLRRDWGRFMLQYRVSSRGEQCKMLSLWILDLRRIKCFRVWIILLFQQEETWSLNRRGGIFSLKQNWDGTTYWRLLHFLQIRFHLLEVNSMVYDFDLAHWFHYHWNCRFIFLHFGNNWMGSLFFIIMDHVPGITNFMVMGSFQDSIRLLKHDNRILYRWKGK